MQVLNEFIIIAISAMIISFAPVVEIPWGVSFACSLYLLVVWLHYEYKNNSGWMHYSKWLLIWFIVYIIIAPFGLFFYGKTTELNTYDYIPASIVISTFGFSWFLVGIKKIIRNKKIEVAVPQIPNLFLAKLIIILLVWVGIALLVSSDSGLIPRSVADQIFILVLIPSLVLISVHDIKFVKEKKIPLILFVGPGVFYVLLTTDLNSSKEKMFLLTAFPLLFGYLTSVFYNKNKIIILSLTVVFFISLFPIVDEIRTERRSRNNIPNIMNITKSLVLGERKIRWEYILHRISIIQNLAGIVKNETKMHPKRPSNPEWIIFGSLIANIPGFLIDKTGFDPNHAQAAGVMLGVYNYYTISNFAITVIGHALWAYSWPGVALIMLAMGAFTAFANKYLASLLNRHWLYFFPYLGVLLCFFHLESNINAFMTFPLRILVIAFLFSSLLKSNKNTLK